MSPEGIKPFDTTVESIEHARQAERETPVPGVVLIWSCERPMMDPIPLENGALELGRAVLVDDDRVSRRHVKVTLAGSRWTITDLESRNGTFVDGERIDGEVIREARVMRIGRSIFMLSEDLNPYRDGMDLREGVVAGPHLKRVYAAIERAAMFGDTIFVRGESGSGKELAARAFHAYGGREAQPFVAVNCAAIPEGLAERLLFGAKKGAYSGANTDATGYLQAADGGTLFLDEVAELDPAVQAKLLRVLETKEVLALGDSTPKRVELRVCSATHRDLRAAVADGKFREDLYFRIGRPEVRIPPIRERLEEIPWLIARELERLGQNFVGSVGFVETCLLRRWPGNVRELAAEVRRAAQEAAAASRTDIEAYDLSPSAGAGFEKGGEASAARHAIDQKSAVHGATGPVAPAHKASLPERDVIENALREEQGNVTRAAKRLGLHRNQLRRWLERNAVDPRTLALDDDE
jgi:transcriptional regulator with PAS, ATPase and Fis domain